MLPPWVELKKTVPKILSVVNSVNPAASGGNAKSANAIVIKIDQVKIGRRVHVTPLARFFTMVVIKLIEDIVTETANNAKCQDDKCCSWLRSKLYSV